MTVEPATTTAPVRAADAALAALFFRECFALHHAYVHRSLLRLGVPERDAEDLTHDVFVVFHRKLDAFDRARPLKPWLFAIAARVAADYRRLARHRHERFELTHEAVDQSLAVDARLEAEDARQLLLLALQSVAEERRPLLIMVDLDEATVPEAALALDIPLNTAYSRLRLARAELADAVHRLRARRGAS